MRDDIDDEINRWRWVWAVALIVLAAKGYARSVCKTRPTASAVVILLDDIGFDLLADACTPELDAFAAGGVSFTNAWVSPACSPTRAQILTGLRAHDHGIGIIVKGNAGDQAGLSTDIPTLPDAWDGPTSFVGKWHLAQPGVDPLTHPLDHGWNSFDGWMYNLGHATGSSYCSWERVTNGAPPVLETAYNTTWCVDRAIAELESMDAPSLLWVAPAGVHAPEHCPPTELPTCSACPPAGNQRAMLEALDAELGRLFDALPPSTFVFVVMDNGTAPQVYDDPKAKGTVYQGGINVPFFVQGPRVRSGVSNALVEANDLWATIEDVCGLWGRAPASSVSFAPALFGAGERWPGRRVAFAERFTTNGDPWGSAEWVRAVRDRDGCKLIERRAFGVVVGEEFYLLPDEENPLPLIGGNYERLAAYLEAELP